MAKLFLGESDPKIEIEREMIDVTSTRPSWRESWRGTDSNGHEHYFDRSTWPPFPTLNEVIDEWHWCEGDEGYAHHDPHKQVDRSHFECKVCGEIVEPTTDPAGTPKWIPGPIRATVSGVRSDGSRIEGWLTPEQVERVGFNPDRATVQALVDELPDEQITRRGALARYVMGQIEPGCLAR